MARKKLNKAIMNKGKVCLLLTFFLFLGLIIIEAPNSLSSTLRHGMSSDLNRYAVITATNFSAAFLMGLMDWFLVAERLIRDIITIINSCNYHYLF